MKKLTKHRTDTPVWIGICSNFLKSQTDLVRYDVSYDLEETIHRQKKRYKKTAKNIYEIYIYRIIKL